MKEKQLICIMCPVGCHLTINEDLVVEGNKCPRGKVYATEEMICPKRILTTTVKTDSKIFPRLSVKTNKPIEKTLLFEALEKLNHITIKKNVKIGDVIVKHILDTDVDIIATKSLIKE